MDKTKAMLLTVCVIALVLISHCRCFNESVYNHTVCVTDQEFTTRQNEEITCSDLCESLNCVGDHLYHSTDVVILKSQTLNTSIIVKGVKSIRFRGISEQIQISCDHSNVGLMILNLIDVTFHNLTLDKCGMIQNSTRKDYNKNEMFLKFYCGIFISNCTNVQLIDLTVSNSPGKGVAFYNTNGSVFVRNCTFMGNKVNANEALKFAEGGGLHIQFHHRLPSQMDKPQPSCKDGHKTNHSVYTITGSKFIKNENLLADSFRSKAIFAFGRGGGMSLHVSTCAMNNTITISNCLFKENTALWGGGLQATVGYGAKSISIHIVDVEFRGNSCPSNQTAAGGGGAAIGFVYDKKSKTDRNTFRFKRCTFLNNRGLFGGGINIFSSHSYRKSLLNNFTFVDCTWHANSRLFGAAVDLYLQNNKKMSLFSTPALPIFENCTFDSNILIPQYTVNLKSKFARQHSRGKGVVISTKFQIHFNRKVSFTNNNGSAIHVITSVLRFGENANVTFINNSAGQGAAIDLIGSSAVVVSNNSYFRFINNTAAFQGGAISYTAIERHSYETFNQCFLDFVGNTNDARNISFVFNGNKAGRNHNINGGNSIFATSFKLCQKRYSKNCEMAKEDILRCIGNFTFVNGVTHTHGSEVTTPGVNFVVDNSSDSSNAVMVTPGKKTVLPFMMEDEFGHKLHSFYHIYLGTTFSGLRNSSIAVGSDKVYTSNNMMHLYGRPGTRADLKIFNMLGLYRTTLTLKVQLQECPPGYSLINDNLKHNLQRCVCSTHTDKPNFGITKCNSSLYRAYLRRTFWVGYDKQKPESEKSLLSARCPAWFCLQLYKTNLLPTTASREKLERAVCARNRAGYLCGKCVGGFTASYHRFKCVRNESCKYGPLLYIAVELLPVTVLFLVIIIFDLRFTAGSTNSFIFFAQLVSLMNIQANNQIWFPRHLYYASKSHHFIYRLFTKDILVGKLSFCLWKDAIALDMLAFRYVTILYSLVLVLVTVTIINKCNVRRIMCRCCIRIRRTRTLRGSIIHGLSAFLILCYWKCTQISFMLLTPACLNGPGETCNHGRRVFYYGEFEFLSYHHLKYAIPAFCVILIIVVLPPLLLLIHPFFYRVYALVDTEESECVRITCKYFPMDTLKPLLDSFQGCFKDRYRYFSGFYFFYRLFVLLILTFSYQLSLSYFLVEILLIVILVIHAIVQPYKKQWHNNLDTLLFADLILINGMTIFNYLKSSSSYYNYQFQIDIVGVFQAILIFIPLFYVAIYIIVFLGRKFICTVREKYKKAEAKVDHLPPLIVTDRTNENDNRYDTFYEEVL